MNPITKNLLILFILFFVTICKAQIVNIPDANFKAKLLAASTVNSIAFDASGNNMKINTNNDFEIQVSEALTVFGLIINNSNINDLTGIESFMNIEILNCNSNLLYNLNLSNNINLTILNCSNNLLNSLNVLWLQNLILLDCSNNGLTSVDVSSNSALQDLFCNNNLLNGLDLSNITTLTTLACSFNNFISFNLGSNYLHILYCSPETFITIDVISVSLIDKLYLQGGNQSMELIIPQMDLLFYLDLSVTKLISLDLTALKNLNSLYTVDNNFLIKMFLKNGGNILNSDVQEINLQYMCVNESDILNFSNTINFSPNVVINTYCTFVPGGDYNTITGTTRNDLDLNGCLPTDQPFSFMKIDYTDGTTNYSTFTEVDGKYNVYTNTGNFTITPAIENPSFYNVSPTSATLNFANTANNTTIQGFCITANGVHPDVEVFVAPIYPSVPTAIAKYQVVFKNKGTETLSGTVNLTYNDVLLDFNPINSTNPNNQATGSLSWNYTNLKPFENKSLEVNFDVIAATNEVLNFSTTITQNGIDELPADNSFAYKEVVVANYDPTRITCLEGATIDASNIGDYLHYIVNFENTSTTAIENVVVKMEIDPTQFDINSLQVLNASNEVYARIKANTAELIFKSANVGGPGGHGNILLKIRTNNLLQEGATIINVANIYFDYEAPVVTDDVTTTFANLKASVYELDASISIYPNPSASQITINSQTSIKNIQLYDAQGRILQSSIGAKNTIDISEKAKGVYFLKITTSKGSKVEKVFKE
jgi:Secretion system C-terminal sorting domain